MKRYLDRHPGVCISAVLALSVLVLMLESAP